MKAAVSILEEPKRLALTWQRWISGRFDEAYAGYSEAQRVYLQAAMALAEPTNLAATTLVWISPDMVDLIRHAARTIPVYNWSPEVLPWPSALLVSAKPLLELAANPGSVSETVEISRVQWSCGGDGAICPVAGWHFLQGFHKSPVPCLMYVLLKGQAFGGKVDSQLPLAQDMSGRATKLLCTLWLLLQQRVAVKRSVRADRATRRRFERENGSPPRDFVIIEIRRPINAAESARRDGVPPEWSHRWMVGGHWREQYHPSDGSHVPTWIAPYIKGPDDKPFIVKDRIQAWVR